MAQSAVRPWTHAEFFAWQERQEVRYELVSGFPLRMMAGASNRHDAIVGNLIAELRNRLRGTPCRQFTADGAVVIRPGQIRRPDVGVDCGRSDPEGHSATEPRLVVEVLSPSTRDFDTFEKLAEYKSLDSLDAILFVEPNRAEVAIWRRADDRSWVRQLVEGLDAVIPLPTLAIVLPLAEIYDRVEVGPRPSLVG
ncbi:MAG: Uma2 family endonuclease [Methylobacteriaceae bacterium]|nr:Uma2 family endonuclease [Methylobacteriaceae bacterium]